MHIINFFIAIIMPFMTIIGELGPVSIVPDYFASDTAIFLAGEFAAIICYWAGYLRYTVKEGNLSERGYVGIFGFIFILMCVSKLIFLLPYMWFISILAFGLGNLSTTEGQTRGRLSLTILSLISLIVFSYATFILLGMAWLGWGPEKYYYFQQMLPYYVSDFKEWVSTLIEVFRN